MPDRIESTSANTEFKVGQLVSVEWDKLGEIMEVLPDGYYAVWVEQDYCTSERKTVHQSKLESIHT